MKQIDPNEYERLTAVVTHATIQISIERSYPDLSREDHDAMFIAVLDRMARMRGWAIRREFAEAEEGE